MSPVCRAARVAKSMACLAVSMFALIACNGPRSSDAFEFDLPSKEGGVISVVDNLPRSESYTQYDLGQIHLIVSTKLLSGSADNPSERRRVLRDFIEDDFFGVDYEHATGERRQLMERSRDVNAANSMLAQDVVFDNAESGRPTVYRVLVGARHVVTFVATAERKGMTPEDLVAFLNSLNPHELN